MNKHIVNLSAGLLGILAANAADTEASRDRSTRVTIAYVNDIHAQLEPHAELFWSGGKEEYVRNAGGLSRIATVFKQLRQQQPGEVLFVDGGDTIQGSGPAAWTDGKVVVNPMNALGLDIAIPGNWSVAYGADAWKARVADFNYEMIAANMTDRETGELLSKPYTIREVNGIRIGVIGFTEPEIATRQPPHLSEGLAFQAEEVLQPLVDKLRKQEKVDLVVLLTHIGLPKATALADLLEGEDIILSADTHERTYEPVVRNGTWIVEAGAFGSFVGKLDLTFDADKKLIDRAWRLIELRPNLIPEDPEMRRIVNRALEPHRERMNRVIGHTNVWLARYAVLNTSMDKVIADSIRSVTGVDVALSNGYRFAPPTAPGAITEADLWNWLPINLRLKTGIATGQQLTGYWERELENVFSSDPGRLFGGWLPRTSGMAVTFTREKPEGQRLRSVTIGGRQVDPGHSYTLAAGDRKGAPEGNIHRVPNCSHTHSLPMTVHDAVRKHLGKASPIRSEGLVNIRCTDCRGAMRSQFISDGPARTNTQKSNTTTN